MDTTVRRPSVFAAPSGRVEVFRNGMPFYVFNAAPGFTFTLPPGRYQVNGGYMLGPLKAKRRRRTARLRFRLPRKVVLRFGVNPNKCSIDLRRGVVLCDPSFRDLPEFALVFVLFHEIGHYFSADEDACDRYAAEQMAAQGYNPSQIYSAARMTMHHANPRGAAVAAFAHTLDHGR